MFEIKISIGSELIEPQYNHVHHATTIKLLEQARLRYLESIGLPNEVLISQGLFLVITKIEVEYVRELHAGPVRVSCESFAVDGKKLLMVQQIVNEKGKVSVRAHIESKVLDGALKRSVVPPIELKERFVGSGPA